MNTYALEPANFADYRDFLKSRFDALKEANPRFSLQACASRSKVSKSLLQFLFRKSRHIGIDKLPTLAKTLKLSPDEEYFVYLMLCKGSSKSPEVKSHFEMILSRIRNQYVKVDFHQPPSSGASEKNLYLDSLLMMLQALLRSPFFREDVGWIRRCIVGPPITTDQIQKALYELERMGCATRDKSGKLVPKGETLWRPDPYDPSGQSVFTSAANAMASFMRSPEIYKPAVYTSMALAFDEENLKRAEVLMIEVHHKLSQLSRQSQSPTAVGLVGNFFLTVARGLDTKGTSEG